MPPRRAERSRATPGALWALALCLVAAAAAGAEPEAAESRPYRVKLVGQNFLLRAAGEERRVDFEVVRYVRAPSPRLAERRAVRAVLRELRVRHRVANTAEDPPGLRVAGIEPLRSTDQIADLSPPFEFRDVD